MKRYNNLYEKIYDYHNVVQAHHMARIRKAHYRGVKMVNRDEFNYCVKISEMLYKQTYIVNKDSYNYMKIIDKGKERDIYKLPYFPHRIIQWAIMLQLEPIFKKMFIHDTYASIRERGLHSALKKIKKSINNGEYKYCLKLDIRKYYPSINNHILYKLIKKRFKDEKLLWLLKQIIFSMGDKGQPIGSLWSQYAGNFYLTEFDHWIKEELKIKQYYRYCDDMTIFGNNKEELHELRKKIQVYLKENLDVDLKPNYQVFPIKSRGIDFLGYRMFPKYTLLRKRTVKTMKRKLISYQKKDILTYNNYCSINSYLGWLLHCNSYNLKCKYFQPLIGKKYYDHNGDIQILDLKLF